jgi:hypothetical protein
VIASTFPSAAISYVVLTQLESHRPSRSIDWCFEIRHRLLTGRRIAAIMARVSSARAQSRATELGCKVCRNRRTGKIPSKMVLAVFAATAPETRFDAARSVEVVHRVEPLSEAARWHSDLDDVREFPLDGFGARAAFVTWHGFNMAWRTRIAKEKKLGDEVQ